MSILSVGLSHRTADLATLERVAVSTGEVAKVLDALQRSEHINEAMVLSTCNRIEVYALVGTFHGGLDAVSEVIAAQAGLEPADLHGHLSVRYAGAAVEHLFSVASGLDSMVVGETQILGQVRSAYASAHEAGTVGRTLHELSQTALRVGKRIHTETGLDALGPSVVSEALAIAGDLQGKHALVIGAGSMGALAVSQLRTAGIGGVIVANRTWDNALRLAGSLSGDGIPAHAVPMAELASTIAQVDVVVSCTGSNETIVTGAEVGPRHDAPLAICDLGLPRDVDAAVAELPGVELVDLEALQRRMQESGSATTDEQITRAQEIVADEVQSYLEEQRTTAVTPTVTALRRRAAEVVDAELLRLDRRIPDLDAVVREELGHTVRRVVDKLLHAPTVRVKQLTAETADTDYANALRELFELDPEAPNAVSSPTAAATRDQSGGEET